MLKRENSDIEMCQIGWFGNVTSANWLISKFGNVNKALFYI